MRENFFAGIASVFVLGVFVLGASQADRSSVAASVKGSVKWYCRIPIAGRDAIRAEVDRVIVPNKIAITCAPAP